MSNLQNEIYNEAIEDKLRDIHAKQYHGLDDEMPDDYDKWRSELTDKEVEELTEKR